MANLDSPSGPPSRDEFAQLLKEAIEKAGEKHPIQYDPEEYCLRTEENGGHTLNLINAYNEYCRASATLFEPILPLARRSQKISKVPSPTCCR